MVKFIKRLLDRLLGKELIKQQQPLEGELRYDAKTNRIVIFLGGEWLDLVYGGEMHASNTLVK